MASSISAGSGGVTVTMTGGGSASALRYRNEAAASATAADVSADAAAADAAIAAAAAVVVGPIAGLADEITALNAISADITTVAGIAADVSAVADIAADVTRVADEFDANEASALAAIAAAELAVVGTGGTIDVREDAAIAAVEAEGGDQVARVAATPGSGQYETKAAGDAAGLATGAHFIVPLAPGLGFEVYRDTGVGTSVLVNTMTDMQALAAATDTLSDALTGLADTGQALISYTGALKADTVTASLRIVQAINPRTGKATGDIPRQTAFAAATPKRRGVEECYELLRSLLLAGTTVVLAVEGGGQSNGASSSSHGAPISLSNRIPNAVTFAGGPQATSGSVVPMISVTKEMPIIGFVEGFYDRLSQEDIPLTNLTVFAFGTGRGATRLSSLGPGSIPWDDKLLQYAAIKSYADGLGAVVIYAGEFFVQGETDAVTVSTTQTAYQAALITRQSQLAAAVTSAFPAHTAPVNIFLSQTSYGAARTYTDGSVVRAGQVVLAQREASRFSDTIHMVDVTYALAKEWGIDGTHRSARGHFIEGYRAGYAAARLWAVGEKPHILDCIRAAYFLNEDGEHIVRAQFNSIGALYWNIDDRDLIDFQRISSTSYGLAVITSARAAVTANEVWIGDDNALWMRLASDPGAGAILRCALDALPWDMSIITNNPNILQGAASNLCCDFTEGRGLLEIPVPDGSRALLRQFSTHFEQTILREKH